MGKWIHTADGVNIASIGLVASDDDSLGSLPHAHFTICPKTSVPWTPTIASAAASLQLNLINIKTILNLQTMYSL